MVPYSGSYGCQLIATQCFPIVCFNDYIALQVNPTQSSSSPVPNSLRPATCREFSFDAVPLAHPPPCIRLNILLPRGLVLTEPNFQVRSAHLGLIRTDQAHKGHGRFPGRGQDGRGRRNARAAAEAAGHCSVAARAVVRQVRVVLLLARSVAAPPGKRLVDVLCGAGAGEDAAGTACRDRACVLLQSFKI